jgi:NAD(P)-dependent dehydrogenase (short-subunit alcohol dehydrogenase family)
MPAGFAVEHPVALVTGAGSGIGREVCLLLAARGFRPALVGRREDTLRETARACGVACQQIPADLASDDAPASIIERCVERWGRIDVLINNAGDSPSATIPQTTPAMARGVFALNAIAPTISISTAWPHFARQAAQAVAQGRSPRAVVVNVSSMATADPFEALYAYAAAKSAVNSLAQSVAKQGHAIGVLGFAVAPGAVETPLLRRIVPEGTLPTAKTLTPRAVAEVIVACVAGERDSVNGRAILLPSP